MLRTALCAASRRNGREGTPLLVATGGLARLIAPLTEELKQQEPDLTLIGLRLAAKHLGLTW